MDPQANISPTSSEGAPAAPLQAVTPETEAARVPKLLIALLFLGLSLIVIVTLFAGDFFPLDRLFGTESASTELPVGLGVEIYNAMLAEAAAETTSGIPEINPLIAIEINPYAAYANPFE